MVDGERRRQTIGWLSGQLPGRLLSRPAAVLAAVVCLLAVTPVVQAQQADAAESEQQSSLQEAATDPEGGDSETADAQTADEFFDEIDFDDSVFDDAAFDDFLDPFSADSADGAATDGGFTDFDAFGADAPAPTSSVNPPFTNRPPEDLLSGDIDEDQLFSQTTMIDEVVVDPDAPAAQDELLTNDGVRVGGRIRGSVDSTWEWGNPWTPEFDLLDADSESLVPSLTSELFFDARPDATFRAFTKIKFRTTSTGTANAGLVLTADTVAGVLPAGFSSTTNEDGDTEIRDTDGNLVTTIAAADDGQDEDSADDTAENEPPEALLGTAPGIELSVFELFMDFSFEDNLLFRFGKHTITWGTGYFWSPADVLNLSTINVEDPTADREGPLSLKTQFPFGVGNNLYLYLILNNDAGPLDVAIAPKIDLFFAGIELGIGIYAQRALAPRLITTFGTTLGDVDLFGEAVLSWGSDRVFFRPARDQSSAADNENIAVALETFELNEGLFFSATAGVRFIKEFEDVLSIFAVGQYLFNGDGYQPSLTTVTGESYTLSALLPSAYRLLSNPAENVAALPAEDQGPDYEAPPDLRFSDVSLVGRHYAAATLGLSQLFGSDLAISTLFLISLSDLSGIVSPSISLPFFDNFSLGLSARFTFGPAGGEYTDPAALFAGSEDSAPTFSISLNVAVSGGSF